MKYQLRLVFRRWSRSLLWPGYGTGVITAVMLFLVTAVALFLRTWGARFGLPYLYHVDEPAYVWTAVGLFRGTLSNVPYDPTGFANILFVEYGALYVLGRILGVFQSIEEFAVVWPGDKLIAFVLLGRYTSALLGTATVGVVYALGARVRSRMTGLLAATFLAVSFLHVRDSHYGVPDIAMTFFVALCVTVYAIAMGKQRTRATMLAGIAGGLAIATKWIALPVLLPALIVAVAGTAPSGESNAGPIGLRSLAVSATGFAVGFALGSFQVLLRPGLYWGKVVEEFLKSDPTTRIWRVDNVPGWLFYVKTLSYGMGIVLLALGVLGALRYLISILRERDRMKILVFSFPLLYFLLMGSTRHYAARYALPLVPFMAVFASEAVVTGTTWAPVRQLKLASALAVALASLAIIQPLSQSIRHDVLLTREDTRTLAKEWIEANVPMGAKIALDWPVFSPPLYGSWSLAPDSDKVYDITVIGGGGVPTYPLDWYREQAFDYVVISSFAYNRQWIKQDSPRKEFYKALDQKFELVQKFNPFVTNSEPRFIANEMYGPAIHLWQRERPGPLIKVYALR